MGRRSFFIKLLIVTVVVIFLCYLAPEMTGRSQASEERYNAEVEFKFKYDQEKTRVIPQVNVRYTDFKNGSIKNIVYEFPEQAIVLPKDTQNSEDTYKNNDPSLPRLFHNDCREYGTHMIDTKEGPQAVRVYCNVIKDKKKDAKGGQKTLQTYILYKYDINRNLLTVLNKAESNGEDRALIDLYLSVGAYGVIDRDMYRRGESRYDKKSNIIYSLNGNKLLARTVETPIEYSQDGVLKYTDYTKVSSKPKKLASYETYFSTTYGNFKAVEIGLHRDGTQTKLNPSPVSSKVKEERIGAFTYVEYPNPKGKGKLVGYRTSKGIKALSRTDASSEMEITKYKKFVLIREKSSKGKVLKFVDAQTAKILWEIMDMDGEFFEEVGDSIFRFYKDKKDYYLHLPTGIVTRNLNISERVQSNKSIYVGSPSKLVSMQAPPQMFVDGKQVHYAGQGPFLTYGTRWYVEVEDIAKAIDASIIKNKDGLTITRGSYIMNVSNKDDTSLNWLGQTFVQIETLNDKLGMAGGFLNVSTSTEDKQRSLHLFSKDLEEKDVIAQPDIFVPDNKANLRYYYVMENGKPTKRSSEEVTAYVSGGVYLIFKDGKPINIATGPNSYLLTLRNFNFDIGKYKDIVAVYGKPQTTNVGNYDVNWYKVEGNVLVFENSAAYYIMQ